MVAPVVIDAEADRGPAAGPRGLGNGPGRVYTLSATATDLAGNATTAVATCTVPHDQGD